MANRATAPAAMILVFAMAVAAFAQTPSLAEIARKEQERRKTTKAPSKVLTNDDLKPAPPPATPPPAAAGTGGASAQADNTKSDSTPSAAASGDSSATVKEGAESKADENTWRSRITMARDELRRNEVFAEALQSRINALTTDFAARDNPIERAQIADERQKALAELDRVKAEVENSRKRIADIEEEARKAGVPPGWLR
jgi:hypothetical protein